MNLIETLFEKISEGGNAGSVLSELKQLSGAWEELMALTQGRVTKSNVVGAVDDLVSTELRMSILLYRRVVRNFTLEDLRNRDVSSEIEYYPVVAVAAEFGVFSKTAIWTELQRLHLKFRNGGGDDKAFFDSLLVGDAGLKTFGANIVEQGLMHMTEKNRETKLIVEERPQPLSRTQGTRKFVTITS
jgi:hypothetical protein